MTNENPNTVATEIAALENIIWGSTATSNDVRKSASLAALPATWLAIMSTAANPAISARERACPLDAAIFDM